MVFDLEGEQNVVCAVASKQATPPEGRDGMGKERGLGNVNRGHSLLITPRGKMFPGR